MRDKNYTHRLNAPGSPLERPAKKDNIAFETETVDLDYVVTQHIKDRNVTNPKLANSSVDSNNIAGSAVDGTHVGLGQIGTQHVTGVVPYIGGTTNLVLGNNLMSIGTTVPSVSKLLIGSIADVDYSYTDQMLMINDDADAAYGFTIGRNISAGLDLWYYNDGTTGEDGRGTAYIDTPGYLSDVVISGKNLYLQGNGGGSIILNTDSHFAAGGTIKCKLDFSDATANRIYFLPDRSGTIKTSPGSVQSIGTNTANINQDADFVNVYYSDLGSVTLTLQSQVAGITGKTYYIKDAAGSANSNNITIVTSGTQLIDGTGTYVMSTDYQSVTVAADGTNWFTY